MMFLSGMALSPGPTHNLAQYRDKCLKQLKTLNTELEKWRTLLKTGMKTLGCISEIKREMLGQRDNDKLSLTNTESHDDIIHLQTLCVELSGICSDLKNVCENLDKVAEKLESLAKLDGDLIKVAMAAEVISKCYRKQSTMNQAIAENVAKSNCEHTLLLHSAVWIHQPGLGSECFIAEVTVEHVLDILS